MSESDELPRPPPPIVGKVNHFSIELYWDHALESANSTVKKGDGRVRVCIQEQDIHNQWGGVYTGYAKRHTVSGLEPQTEYTYRIRFLNNDGVSEWSAHATVNTTKEPLSGEHLHSAIRRKDLSEIERILDTGDVYIDVPDKYGFSGLMQASQKGYLDIMKILISHDADVNAANEAGKVSLMLACFAGQREAVQLLRESGASYDARDHGGSTAMHWACDSGNGKLIDWMINDGADVNAKDRIAGWTPLLRVASVGGSREAALSLLLNGADINARDNDGKTTLMIAIVNGFQPLLELLLKRNADLNIKNAYGKTAFDMAQSMEKRRIIKTLEEYYEKQGIKTY